MQPARSKKQPARHTKAGAKQTPAVVSDVVQARNRQGVYDSEIAPLLDKIKSICDGNGISFFAAFNPAIGSVVLTKSTFEGADARLVIAETLILEHESIFNGPPGELAIQ